MAWHSGATLAQTVYTCMFVHHLDDLDPDYAPAAQPALAPVLRAAVLGLLKSVDLAWRELSTCRVLDVSPPLPIYDYIFMWTQQEDWQSEKCEISLLESTPWQHVDDLLDDTSDWLLNACPSESPPAPIPIHAN